jgi:hypothetical protein
MNDWETKAERVFLDVIFLGAAVAAVLVISGVVLVLTWLLIAWLCTT